METATCCCRSTRTARSRGRASISARSVSRCTRWTMSPGCCFCGPRRARWSATGCERSRYYSGTETVLSSSPFASVTGAAILQRRRDAECAKASVATQGLLHRCPKGPLRLGQRRALALRGGVILACCNRVSLDDLTGGVVDNHLVELAVLHRIDGELQLAFVHLELGGDWLAVTGARRQTTLEGHTSAQHRLCHRSLVPLLFALVLGRERAPPAHRCRGQHRDKPCLPRHVHVMPPISVK